MSPVLAEHEPLLVRVFRAFQDLPEPLELGFLTRIDQPPRPLTEVAQDPDLVSEFLDRDSGHRSEHRVLVVLVAFAETIIAKVVGRVVKVEEIGPMLAVQAPLGAVQACGIDPPGLDIGDQLADLLDPALERLEESPGRASQPSLKHPHRELDRLPVARREVVGMLEIGRGAVVEILLTVRSGG